MEIRARLTLRVAWWVRPYLAVLVVLCTLMDREPYPERVGQTVRRGLRINVETTENT